MKRTTLALDDDLQRRLKEKAASEGRTLQSLANELLRQAMEVRERPSPDYRLELGGWKADAQPGADILDRDAMIDTMEDH